MAKTDSSASAAATKIQATVRGSQDRKRVESHISDVIEAMTEGKEPPPFPVSSTHSANTNQKPLSTTSFFSDDGDHHGDDSSVEEEVIVVIDDSYTDHTRDEILAEFVMDAPTNKPLPSPPRKKSAFEAYNDQLKASVAKPRGAAPPMKKKLSWKASVDEPAEAASIDDSIAFEKPKSTSSMSLDSNSSHHIRKGAQGWWGTNKKTTPDSQPESVPEDSMASVPTETVTLPAKMGKAKARTSEVTIDSVDDFLEPEKPKSTSSVISVESNSSHRIKKGAQGWWGAKGKPKPKETDESGPKTLVEESTEGEEPEEEKQESPPVVAPVVSKDEQTSSQLESTKSVDEKPKPKPVAKSSAVALPSWVKKNTSNAEDSEEKVEKPVVKRKPVAMPSWLKKKNENEDEVESKPVERSPIKRSPVPMPKWVQKKDLQNELPSAPDLEDGSETAEAKVAPPTRKWKKPEAKTETPPAKTSDALQSEAPKESTTEVVDKSEGTAELEIDSNHQTNKLAVPWLKPKPATPETSEREQSPPPPTTRPLSPRAGKSKIVNRYLSKLSKDDESERARRMAEIEADRARGRWDGKGYVRDGDEGGDGSKQGKNWKYMQPKENQEQFDKGVAIKLQALVRGFLARRRVAKYVDELIEEMMRKLSKAHAEEEARLKAIEDEERRKKEEEEFRLWQEREEERRKNEEKEILRRMHDDRYGLPLWWMKMIPHKTMEQKEYDAIVKDDNGATVVDYKLPPRNKERLDAVTEEESEADDENNSNLDKILEASARAQRTVSTSKPKKQPNTMTKGKKKSSMFGCMNVDSVEPEANVNGNSNAATKAKDNNDGRDDKEDTESEPEPQQESAPPVVTKLWM